MACGGPWSSPTARVRVGGHYPLRHARETAMAVRSGVPGQDGARTSSDRVGEWNHLVNGCVVRAEVTSTMSPRIFKPGTPRSIKTLGTIEIIGLVFVLLFLVALL